MNIASVILSDLKERFGNRVHLFPADLVEILSMSEGQQANLRSQGRFPLPYFEEGGRIKISIYALAEYLSKCATASAKIELKREISITPDKPTRVEKKKKQGHLESGWWQLRCNSIYSIIRQSQLQYELSNKIHFKSTLVRQ